MVEFSTSDFINDINGFHQIEGEITKPVVVEFYYSGCKHCKNFDPVYKEIAQKYRDDIDFYRIDIEGEVSPSSAKLLNACGIKGFPTTLGFTNGKVDCALDHDKISGYRKQQDFESWINSIINKRNEE